MLREEFAEPDRVQPATHREDRIRLRSGRRVISDPIREPNQGPSCLLDILGRRDRWNERVDGRPNQPHPALTGWVPVEDPVSSSLDDVEGLTRTDDCDGGRVRSA